MRPNKPAQQMQHARGFIVGCANGWLWSPGRQSTRKSKLGELYMQKTILSAYYIRVTRWLVTRLQSSPIGTNFAGYMFTKQCYWYNFAGFCSNLGARGLFSSPAGFYWVHIDWPAPGHPMGAGNPTISRETETQVPAACQPQPQQPHIIKLIS